MQRNYTLATWTMIYIAHKTVINTQKYSTYNKQRLTAAQLTKRDILKKHI